MRKLKTNPYQKIYHMAKLFGQDGEVSPLCADWPKPINLNKALWTICKEAVTCKKCKKRMQGCPHPQANLAVAVRSGKAGA